MNTNSLRLEVLISCMYEKDLSIVKRTNIQSDVIVVNQCDNNDIILDSFSNCRGKQCSVKMINTTERGLSRSRNMAIKHSTSDICLICDDDEVLVDDYPNLILSAFEKNPGFDIIAFSLKNPESECPSDEKEITYWGTGKLSSWQIAFRRNQIILSTPFNVLMGSGTGNGGGEENKFLIDCISKGAKIKYVPLHIGEVSQSDSQWFHGYDKKYWINRGWVAKMIYGKIRSFIYIIGQSLLRVYFVDKNHNPFQICWWMLKGWFEIRQ